MARSRIEFADLRLRPHYLWLKQWLLLTAGDFSKGDFNSMTVGWGSFGTMWNKPFAQIVVRPTRYTYGFLERYDFFTLCVFPEPFRKDLVTLGTKSGRDGDKMAEVKITPKASTLIAAPGFTEAELTVECRKIYSSDFEPARFLDARIEKQYPEKDYHRVYFGEISAIFGEPQYSVNDKE